MQATSRRHDGRRFNQLREIKVAYNVFGYAPGSVIFEMGNTKVLCSVSISASVPPFLKGKKTGWLSAEYAMLPCATQTRTTRETTAMRANGRTIEISRLIGRVLRSVVNLDALGERTIHVDCDVLQADGGTRTASITGSWLALRAAVDSWLKSGLLQTDIITDAVAAISLGVVDGNVVLDVDYQEDSQAQADFNFVLTRSGAVLEIQGTAEQRPLAWNQFDEIRQLACEGVQTLFNVCDQQVIALTPSGGKDGLVSAAQSLQQSEQVSLQGSKVTGDAAKAPLFSLASRYNS